MARERTQGGLPHTLRVDESMARMEMVSNPSGGPQETNRRSITALTYNRADKVGIDLPSDISPRLASQVIERATVSRNLKEHNKNVERRVNEKRITKYREVFYLGRKYEVASVDLKTGTVVLKNLEGRSPKKPQTLSVFSKAFDLVPEIENDLKPENLSISPSDNIE